MAYKITSACVGCGSCAAACPMDAIKEEDGVYKIDDGACVSCGSCAGTCPNDAIVEE